MSKAKISKDQIQLQVIRALRLSVVPIAIWEIYTQNWQGLLIAFFALLFMYSPDILQRWYKFKLPLDYSLFMVFFVFASLVLGEFGGAYERFWWWDAVLHVSSAAVFGLFAFLGLYVAKLSGRLDISPTMFGFLVFSVGMMVGGVWEIAEFSLDSLFGLNMQKSGLQDTMGDLIVGAIGSLAMAFGTRQFLLNGEKGGPGSRFVAWAVDSFLAANPKVQS